MKMVPKKDLFKLNVSKVGGRKSNNESGIQKAVTKSDCK